MLRSMTGFGNAQLQVEGVDYSVEIRSVNGRYFKANIKLPELWSHAETEIEKMLRRHLSRGTVNFTLRMRSQSAAAAYTVNLAALRRYMQQAWAALPKANVELGAMLTLPGVCEPPSADDVCERHRPALFAAIDRAMECLQEMRRQEGEALRADLLGHCRSIEQRLEKVEARKDLVVTDFQKRLLDRVNELVRSAKLSLGEQDLAREVALFAERSDVSEEINRLRGHLAQFRQAADQEEQAGRKLDFITQEMLREANTIASKANDAEIIRAVVDIKTSIDRVKEQVQNAE
jgi:uncharacterized protein (TIGR00255 family)